MDTINHIIKIVKQQLNITTNMCNIPDILNQLPTYTTINNLEFPLCKEGDEGIQNIYCKKKFFSNNHINGFIIYWNSNALSPIHGHDTEGCYFKTLSNGILEHKYKINNNTNNYIYIKTQTQPPNITQYIDNSIGYHSIQNTNSHIVASIHFYQNNHLTN